MSVTSVIARLEREWDEPDGFLSRLRTGTFDPNGLERLAGILQSVDIETTATVLDRRLVELTWYIPQFMSWQRERVQEQGEDVQKLDDATLRIGAILEDILGVP